MYQIRLDGEVYVEAKTVRELAKLWLTYETSESYENDSGASLWVVMTNPSSIEYQANSIEFMQELEMLEAAREAFGECLRELARKFPDLSDKELVAIATKEFEK